MGNDNAKLLYCSFCGADKNETNEDDDEKAQSTSIFASNIVSGPTPVGKNIVNAKNNNNNNNKSTAADRPMLCNRCHLSDKRCHLKHIFLAPFADTLQNIFVEDEEKEITPEFLVTAYLKPFFKKERGLMPVRAGSRIIVDSIEFKVLGCYPPRGFVSNKTHFHLTDEHNQLIELTFKPLREIHILPTQTSLQTYRKYNPSANNDNNNNNNNNNNSNNNNSGNSNISNSAMDLYQQFRNRFSASDSDIQMNNNDNGNDNGSADTAATTTTTTPNDDNAAESHSNSDLYASHLKPYLLQKDDQLFYFIHQTPPANATQITKSESKSKSESSLYSRHTNNNNNNNNNNNSNSNSHRHRHRNKQGNTRTNNGPQKIEFNNNVSEKAFKRHLVLHEVFFYKGIQFRVQRCEPLNNGFITGQTNILCHGLPLSDISDISLRPIYEDLPSRQKHLLPTQIKSHYLDPYFKKQSWIYISHRREIVIKKVRFSIRKCVPHKNGGLITCATKFDFNAAPVKELQLQCMQEAEDEQLAQALMREQKEAEERAIAQRRLREQRTTNSEQIMQAAEYELMMSDPISQMVNEVLQRMLERRYRAQQQRQSSVHRGIHPSLVERLPTFMFQKPSFKRSKSDGNLVRGGGGGSAGSAENVSAGAGAGASVSASASASAFVRYEYKDDAAVVDDEESKESDHPMMDSSNGHGNGDTEEDSLTDDVDTTEEDEYSDNEALQQKLQMDSNINISCRICLEFYITGEELRMLPCFHKYHKDCVDKWFQMSRKCPICKTPVVRPVST